MKTHTLEQKNAVMPVGRIGQRRQVVIPKGIFEDLGLTIGDFVEVVRVKGTVVIRPKKLVDPEDTLTLEEEKIVSRGEKQFRAGQYKSWQKIKHEMAR